MPRQQIQSGRLLHIARYFWLLLPVLTLTILLLSSLPAFLLVCLPPSHQEVLGSCGIASGSWCPMKVQQPIPPSLRRRGNILRKALATQPNNQYRLVLRKHFLIQTPDHIILLQTELMLPVLSLFRNCK